MTLSNHRPFPIVADTTQRPERRTHGRIPFAASFILMMVTVPMGMPHSVLASPVNGPHKATGGTPHDERDCFSQLRNGGSRVIDCRFPVRMTDEELAQVRSATRGLLQDASCLMTIHIERQLINDAIADTQDHVFNPPPQPVACEVTTSRGTLPIAFTFAPRVEFKGGMAVKASPKMDNVTGVSSVLAWPVVTYVNANREIGQTIVQVVNAYIKFYGREARAQP